MDQEGILKQVQHSPEDRRKETENKKKEMPDLSPNMSIITSYVYGLNMPIKGQRLTEWIKNRDSAVCRQQGAHTEDEQAESQRVGGDVSCGRPSEEGGGGHSNTKAARGAEKTTGGREGRDVATKGDPPRRHRCPELPRAVL